MCCNVAGLGALNVFWLIFGTFFALMSIGASLDCSADVNSFMGVTHSCTSLEDFMHVQWNAALAGWSLSSALLAYLPKLLGSGYPGSANKAVMRVVTGVFFVTQLITLYPVYTTTIQFDSGPVKAPPVAMAMWIGPLVLCLIAFIVHKDPGTGAGML